jgi:hypothetical protein
MMMDSQREIPLRVSAYGDVDEVLSQFVRAAPMQQRRDSTCDSTAQRYVLEEPQFRLSHVSSIFPSVIGRRQLDYAKQIAACGINIKSACLSGLVVEPRDMVESLQAVMSTATPNEEGAHGGAIQEIVLARTVSRQLIPALFSALRTSRGVRALCVENAWYTDNNGPAMSHDDRDCLWEWMAFSIFSPFAVHRLKLLRVDATRFSESNAQAFCGALSNPESVTLTGGPDHAVRILSRQVVSSRFSLSAPTADGGEMIELPLQQVLVVEADGTPGEAKWVQVLLPGYGLAWVDQDDIRSSMASIPHDASRRSHPKITLTDLKDESLGPVLELLRAIGHKLTVLSIVNIACSMPLDDWIKDVVAACPRLENFIVRGGLRLQSLDVFSELYESRALRASSIGVAEVVVADIASIPRLLLTLEDESHAMTQQLHKIAICPMSLSARIPRIVPALEKLLSANRQLKDVTFHVSYLPRIVPAEAFDSVRRVHETHFGEPVALRREALDSRSKMAFLRVTSGRCQRTRGARFKRVADVMLKLDRSVLTLMFEFAAVSETRKLLIHFRTEDVVNESDDGEEEDEEEWETESDE